MLGLVVGLHVPTCELFGGRSRYRPCIWDTPNAIACVVTLFRIAGLIPRADTSRPKS